MLSFWLIQEIILDSRKQCREEAGYQWDLATSKTEIPLDTQNNDFNGEEIAGSFNGGIKLTDSNVHVVLFTQSSQSIENASLVMKLHDLD